MKKSTRKLILAFLMSIIFEFSVYQTETKKDAFYVLIYFLLTLLYIRDFINEKTKELLA